MRFCFCAAAIERILSEKFTGASSLDRESIIAHIQDCQTSDGAYSWTPWGEGHAGLTWCAVGTLRLFDRTDLVDTDRLVSWCLHRHCGGFCGRMEKFPPDTCYSFFNLGSLAHIDTDLVSLCAPTDVERFTQMCSRFGGFAKLETSTYPDVHHTYYSLAAMSLLGLWGLERLDPVLGICIN